MFKIHILSEPLPSFVENKTQNFNKKYQVLFLFMIFVVNKTTFTQSQLEIEQRYLYGYYIIFMNNNFDIKSITQQNTN